MRSKNKDKIAELKQKVFERQKLEAQHKEAEELSKDLDKVAYDVIRVPGKGNTFELIKVKYNLETKKAVVDSKVELDQKVIGMTFKQHKEGLDSIFSRLFKVQNKEAN